MPTPPSVHIETADRELNYANQAMRAAPELREEASAHALVAIAQLLEAQNHLLGRIADGIYLAAGER